jgi:hypothetical protein
MTVVIGNELVNVVNPACPASELRLKPESVDVVGLSIDEERGVEDSASEDIREGSEAVSEPEGIKVDPPLVVHQLFCVSVIVLGRRGRTVIWAALGALVVVVIAVMGWV